MKIYFYTPIYPGRCFGTVSTVAFLAVSFASTALAENPYDEPIRPPSSEYSGPLFELSSDYPTDLAPHTGLFPWQAAIGGGQITTANAATFAQALKDHVSPDMTVLMYDYENWDAGAAGWYNQPWLSTIRDGIHGTYQGSGFPPEMFPASGLKTNMTTHVAVYYDERAAVSLSNTWGTSGTNPEPAIFGGDTLFAEGGLIVKPALTTATGAEWPPMEGSVSWPIYASPDGTAPVNVFNAQFFQFDIVVKDSLSAPESQWVYMTLVYDKDAPGITNWEKMVPLGVMWGNDPDVNSPMDCSYLPPNLTCPTLSETWINPNAPIYSKETLGWGGRLSGPNDAAVDINARVLQSDGSSKPYNGRYAMSSCMGCHGAASYEMGSFLLPSPSDCANESCRPTMTNKQVVYYPSGSSEYMAWFQNRRGDVPQVAGTTALDYGMNYAFKSLPLWNKATGQGKLHAYFRDFNDYRGISPDHLTGN